jgi:hypothetical protein
MMVQYFDILGEKTVSIFMVTEFFQVHTAMTQGQPNNQPENQPTNQPTKQPTKELTMGKGQVNIPSSVYPHLVTEHIVKPVAR